MMVALLIVALAGSRLQLTIGGLVLLLLVTSEWSDNTTVKITLRCHCYRCLAASSSSSSSLFTKAFDKNICENYKYHTEQRSLIIIHLGFPSWVFPFASCCLLVCEVACCNLFTRNLNMEQLWVNNKFVSLCVKQSATTAIKLGS